MNGPFAVDFGADGTMYVAEMYGHRVSALDPSSRQLRVFAGTGSAGHAGDGGPAGNAQLNGPHHLIVHPHGQVYIADTRNHRIRRVDPRTGVITTFAGGGPTLGDGGPAAAARFDGVFCLALDPAGKTMYVADTRQFRIRAIELDTGVVRTFAGTGHKGQPIDGRPAAEQPLDDPRAVAVDRRGRVYILERAGGALLMVDTDGRIRRVASAGSKPKYVAIDRSDNVLYVEDNSARITIWSPTTMTATRLLGGSNLPLREPHGVYQDARGRYYIADSDNHRVVELAP